MKYRQLMRDQRRQIKQICQRSEDENLANKPLHTALLVLLNVLKDAIQFNEWEQVAAAQAMIQQLEKHHRPKRLCVGDTYIPGE